MVCRLGIVSEKSRGLSRLCLGFVEGILSVLALLQKGRQCPPPRRTVLFGRSLILGALAPRGPLRAIPPRELNKRKLQEAANASREQAFAQGKRDGVGSQPAAGKIGQGASL